MSERIFSFGGHPVKRLTTVGGLRAAKGRHRSFAQVTAETAEEAAAAEAAGIEMIVCRARNVVDVRRGSNAIFVTAALGFAEAVTDDEILRTAFRAVTDGADAVLTGRRLEVVERLASEDLPVVGHLGFVPRKSTWIGSVRGVGRDLDEAAALFQRFRRLEDAGAFAVEAELISAQLMSEISRRSGLVTISLGSGPAAEVQFLFTSDICGQSERLPRHARRYGDLPTLLAKVQDARVSALRAFRQDVAGNDYPAAGEMIEPGRERATELVALLERLSSKGKA